MDPALLTALAAVAGSIVGGLASFATTFFTQSYQARRDLLSRDAANREELYSQFIKETTNQYIDSLDKTLNNPVALIGVYSLVGRIRLIAGDKVLSAAEAIKAGVGGSIPSLATITFNNLATIKNCKIFSARTIRVHRF